MRSASVLVALCLLWPVAGHAQVVINEFEPNPAGVDDGLEWIELYNPTGAPVNIDGWSIQTDLSDSFYTTTYTLPVVGFEVPSMGYFVLGEEYVTAADLVMMPGERLALGSGSGGDGVRLVDASVITIDTVVYGGGNVELIRDDSDAIAGSFAPAVTEGMTLARSPNGTDTDQSGDDFIVDGGTFGATNPDPPACEASTGGVVINELVPDPLGTEGQDLGWIELYNDGGATVSLESWELQFASSVDSWATKYVFAAGDELLDMDWLVVGEAAVTERDFTAALSMTGGGAGGDALRLVDCEGTPVDTVVFGGNSEEHLDDLGAIAAGAPDPGDGDALARYVDGDDTDDSSVDFWIVPYATPGAANPPPPACEPSTGTVVINELVPDPLGSEGQGLEYVELYNNGGTAVSLEGWELQFASSPGSYSAKYVFLAGDQIFDVDFLVLGESAIPEADIVVTLGLTGGGAGGDTLRLVDCEGTPVDTVIYGGNTELHLDDLGATDSPAPDPGDGDVLARIIDGLDTDRSADDFWVATSATPGTSNPLPPVCDLSTGGVVINEFLPNPAGTDSAVLLEYVELFNGSGAEVDLEGWALETSTSAPSFSTVHVFGPSALFADAGFYLVGEDNVPGADEVGGLGLPGGSGADALRLVDCDGYVVDTVVYGSDNTEDLHLDDGLAVATSLAPVPGSDDAISRRYDGVDTDASGDDFWIASAATPGAANPEPPVCVPSAGDVVINEFLPNPDGADEGYEWIELYSTSVDTVTPLSLEGWEIHTASGETFSRKVALPEGAEILGESYFVVGEINVLGADFALDDVIGMGTGTGGDGVRLVDCAGTVVDTVVYGDAINDDLVPDDSGTAATSVAEKPGETETVARRVDGVDTDDCGADFFVADVETMGSDNPEPPVCVASTGGVVINELVSDPPGADGDVLLEWIELYNSTGATLDLDGWQLATASSDSYSVKVELPAETQLPAGGYLLVGETNVVGADVLVEGTLGMGTGLRGDGVRLLDCEGTAVDTVVYTNDGTNEDGVVDDSGSISTSLAASPSNGASLARKDNGVDTDASYVDFTISNEPTPGAANPLLECFPSGGTIRLNEVLPNPSGSDSEVYAEWIELHNAGTSAVRLDGWKILTATKADDVDVAVVLPPQSTIEPGGFWVVGGQYVPAADYVTDLSIPNGTGGDAVLLYDCEDTPIDTLVYGSDNDDGLLDDSGAVADPVPNPSDDKSAARREDGVDTDGKDDWFVDVSPTPGETNYTEVPVIVDDDSGGCNKRGDAPDGSAPGGCGSTGDAPDSSGCTTVPMPFGGFEIVFAAFALVRRRGRR